MKILNKIAYACGMPIEDKDLNGKIITVIPTCPYDPNDDEALEEAQASMQRSWGASSHSMGIPTFEFENEPFSLKLIRCHIGGTTRPTYSVIDDKARRFSLTERAFIEAVTVGGIEKGGQFLSTFVWGNGVDPRLFPVGGDSHYNAVNAKQIARDRNAKLREKAPLTASNLVVGKVYESFTPIYHYGLNYNLFVGRVICPFSKKKKYVFFPMNSTKPWWYRKTSSMKEWHNLSFDEQIDAHINDRHNCKLFLRSDARMVAEIGEADHLRFRSKFNNIDYCQNKTSLSGKFIPVKSRNDIAEELRLSGKSKAMSYTMVHDKIDKIEQNMITNSLIEYKKALVWI